MIWSHGVYTRYPFQANMHGLPPQVAYDCLMGFLEAQQAPASGDGGFSNDRLFYSRRIGRSPRFTPAVGANEFLDMPRSTSIETAVKLTGKTQGGLSIGIMDAVTGQENATIDLNGQRREVAVEPLTNYFVGRVQKDYNDGNTAIGGMITATNRDIKTENLNFLNKAAYSGGIDFRHQWKDKTYKFELKGHGFSYY